MPIIHTFRKLRFGIKNKIEGGGKEEGGGKKEEGGGRKPLGGSQGSGFPGTG